MEQRESRRAQAAPTYPLDSEFSPPLTDAVLHEATGRTRAEWFAALDLAGAASWDHARIARWLGGKDQIDAWWAQYVVAQYETTHVRPRSASDAASFAANVSRTIPRSPGFMWPLLDDDDARRAWLDCEFAVLSRSPERSLRMQAADGSRITISLHALAPYKSGGARTRIDVVHSSLPSATELSETLAFWKASLSSLVALTEQD